jgi:hypothetical protein
MQFNYISRTRFPFTDQKAHSKDIFSQDIISSSSPKDVEDIYGKTIKTSKNLYIYLSWIQNRIAKENNIEFIDGTEGGARIKRIKVMDLNEAIKQYGK